MNANAKLLYPMTPVFISPTMVKVCMNCHPGLTILADYPWLAGYEISHGVCEYHFNLWKANFALDKSLESANLVTATAN